LEKLPLENDSVDFVMSNCVINLSVDKKKVFKEIYRVMKDGGSFSISDIVSDKEVPEHLQKDPELWSGCISGALTAEKYLKLMEETGFFGLKLFKQSVWKEVEGIKFKSLIVKGHKLSRSKECVFIGQTATYIGPLKKAEDDEDHVFLRGIPQEVCTETAKRLSRSPYDKSFIITDPTKKITEGKACDPKNGCC
jgi:SAM-dependent methyltransferase